MIAIDDRTKFAAALGVTSFIGFATNMLVLIIYTQNRQLRSNASSSFMINLSLADTFNLLFGATFTVSALATSSIHMSFLEETNAFLTTIFETASVLVIGVISFDRMVAVRKPLQYRARMTRRRAKVLIRYVWVQASVFALLPYVLGWFEFNINYFSCTFSSQIGNIGFITFLTVYFSWNYVLTMILVVVFYLLIYQVARKRRRQINCAVVPSIVITTAGNATKKEAWRRSEIQTACKVTFVAGVFLLCSSPYATVRLMELSGYFNNRLPEKLMVLSKCILYTKSAINPTMYFIMRPAFRNAFRGMLRRLQGRFATSSINERVLASRNQIQLGSPIKHQLSDMSIPVVTLSEAEDQFPSITDCNSLLTMTVITPDVHTESLLVLHQQPQNSWPNLCQSTTIRKRSRTNSLLTAIKTRCRSNSAPVYGHLQYNAPKVK